MPWLLNPFDLFRWLWYRKSSWTIEDDGVFLYLKHNCNKTYSMLRVAKKHHNIYFCMYCKARAPDTIVTQAKLLNAYVFNESEELNIIS